MEKDTPIFYLLWSFVVSAEINLLENLLTEKPKRSLTTNIVMPSTEPLREKNAVHTGYKPRY